MRRPAAAIAKPSRQWSERTTTIVTALPTLEPAPHCRIDGYVTTTDPGPNKVHFRLQLPDHGFNGRYVFAGLGGAAGYVPSELQLPQGNPVTKGFAMAGTDTGHQGETLDWSFMAGSPAETLDYAHRGGHVIAVATQAITRTYYGIDKLWRYHTGCSGGGRMGVQAVERHPEDYDGVLIGAPGRSTATMLMFMWATKQMVREPGAWLSPTKLEMIDQRVTSQCDAADGVLDGIVAAPDKCGFKPETLACRVGEESDCLIEPELETFTAILEGPHRPDGTPITGGMPLTNTAEGWTAFLGATPPPWSDSIAAKDIAAGKTNAAAVMGHVISKLYFGEDFDYFRDFDFSDPRQFDAWWAAADRIGWGRPHTANLRAAEQEDVKIIWWHGISDAGPTLDTTFGYRADALQSLDGNEERLDAMYQLYTVPGMLHCGGGSGPDDVPDQLLRELIEWTERGVAPGPAITGRGGSKARPLFREPGTTVAGVPVKTSSGTDREFLLCPFPQQAKFNGPPAAVGEASHWRCVDPG